MQIALSTEEAKRFLVRYHLTTASIAGVMDRLGCIQYDPLNPVGRNVDLVLQARVPEYRVDDWQAAVYGQRLAYDAWDKQASLVPVADWPHRALIREQLHPWHDRQILAEYPEMVDTIFADLDRRGPLSSLEFEDRRRAPERHLWYGPTVVKRVLRALWARGLLVTHHREAGRHYYDRPERVIPDEHLHAEPVLDRQAYLRWIVLRRHQSAGLLRPSASAEIWSVCGTAAERASAVADLIAAGALVTVQVGGTRQVYRVPAEALGWVQSVVSAPRVTFLGPLDNLIWDRKALRDLFGFDYIWEVYKKPQDRRWGYYVLPVLYGDRFVARVDSRLEDGTWNVARWWWEDGLEIDEMLLHALGEAAAQFQWYLGARGVRVARGVDSRARQALKTVA